MNLNQYDNKMIVERLKKELQLQTDAALADVLQVQRQQIKRYTTYQGNTINTRIINVLIQLLDDTKGDT